MDPEKNSGELKTPISQEVVETLMSSDIVSTTHTQVENVIDVKPLVIAIENIGSNSKTLAVMGDILKYDTDSKEEQQITSKILLNTFLKEQEKRHSLDERNTFTIEYLENFYEFIQRYKEYFGNFVNEDWYRDINVKLVNALLQPFVLYSSGVIDPEKEPLWVARDHVERMDLLEKINSEFPIDDIEERRQSAKNGTAIILKSCMGRGFHTGVIDDNNAHNDYAKDKKKEEISIIREIAKRFDITLPEEQEIWERDVITEVTDLLSTFSISEEKQKKNRRAYELDKRKKEIEEITAFLNTAQQKFKNLKLPEGFTSVSEIINSFENRLQAIVDKDVEMEIEKRLEGFRSALDAGDIKRIENYLTLLSEIKFPEQIRFTNVLNKSIDKIQQQRARHASALEEMTTNIQTNSKNTTQKDVKSLTTHALAIKELDELIQKINERI